MINLTAFNKLGSTYQFAPANGMTDTALLGLAQEYQSQVSRNYIPLSNLDLGKFTQTTDVAISIKYDGEGNFLFWDESKDLCVLYRPQGRARIGLDCMEEAKAKLKKKGIKKALLVCELYLKQDFSIKTQRTQIADVIRASFSTDVKEQGRLSLAFYDIVMWQGKDRRNDEFKANLELMTETFGMKIGEKCHVVEHAIAKEKDVPAFYEKWVRIGGDEGICVRNLSGQPQISKIKPTMSIDAAVIGFVEDQVGVVYGVSSLLLALKYKDNWIEVARVGSGLDLQLRQDLLPELQKQRLASTPVTISDSSGKIVQFVKPSMVVEFNAEDALYEESRGGTHFTRAFTQKPDGSFTYVGMTPFPRMSFPTFGKLRPDKQPQGEDIRVSQIVSDTMLTGDTIPLKQSASTPAKIVSVRIFAKTGKAGSMVRKYIVTQRENSYFILSLDYSPDRAEKLKSTLMTAYTKDRMEKLLTDQVNGDLFDDRGKVKRGWAENVA